MAPLTEKQERAVEALLTCATYADAAAACDVDSKTLYRWRQEEAFQAALRRGRLDVHSGTVTALVRESLRSVEVLAQARDHAPKPSDQIRAATALVQLAMKALEAADLQAELEDLRQQLEKIRHGKASNGHVPSAAAGRGAGHPPGAGVGPPGALGG
jgi:hypothetical protein